ncbi:FlaD/FlaE family flagellar protein [Natrinema salaciae]|uniref:Flagella accessory protein C (FlaC) n=1 Tax=Natrinema salaciae TaxID=1186196 RepID=A0A1H9M7X1_9EURY|nr:FlaD/FlaE family flagellar protein [Natrinema salaciae]SER19794.1 Flagella accessory protein C (FlaC) [Natrinema salaciae]
MDFGLDSLRTVIEDFLSNSGGRRGRQREEQRQEGADPFEDDASAADAQAEDDETTETDESGPDEGESAASDAGSESSGGLFSRGSSSTDEDDLDDLFYRIEELEEELDDKESTLGTVQDSQQQVADQVEEMNDTVRQLLGVYDMLTDDVNPFTGAGEERNGFGVFGEDDATREESTEGGMGVADGGSTVDAGTETVSFDDLKGVIEDAAAQSERAGRDGGETITFDEDGGDGDASAAADADDTSVEVQATESVDGPEDDESDETADAADGDGGGSDVTLETLADTYATDIIVLEWLTDLVRTAGPAATLRAISYYAEIGWIDKEVRDHLEATLSGPDLDIHVDPGATPEELTAEDHADSYTYIMKLQEIHETKRDVEPNAESGP